MNNIIIIITSHFKHTEVGWSFLNNFKWNFKDAFQQMSISKILRILLTFLLTSAAICYILSFSINCHAFPWHFLFTTSNKTNGIETYPWEPITNIKILPYTYPIPATIGHTLSIKACQGEFEPTSFIIHANKEFKSINIIAQDLIGPGGKKFPASAADIRLVKCWYKSSDKSIRQSKTRILTPELLLHDNSLIKVDCVSKKNYLKVKKNGRSEYLDISSTGNAIPSGVTFDDSDKLQPFNLAAGQNIQVWVTVKVPSEIEAGNYKGQISLTSDGKTLGELTINVEVLPFDLSKPILEYALYYRGILSSNDVQDTGSEIKNPDQYERELKNIKNHGIDYPTIFQRLDDIYLYDALDLRQRAHLPHDRLYTLGTTTGNKTDSISLEKLSQRVQQWKKLAARYGYGKVLIYGVDEARAEQLTRQKPSWDVVHREGAGMFVALYEGAADVAGNDIDVAVLSGYKPGEVDKWHHRGKRVLCYGNPQVGIPNPLIYRRNYGFMLWAGGYDGCMPYAYQHAFGDIWNDFDHPDFRDHVFAYPTTSGLVDTVQWEGFREAVGDIRYLSTLLEMKPQSAPEVRSYIVDRIKNAQTNPSDLRRWIIGKIMEKPFRAGELK